MSYGFSREKLPKGFSYPLKRSLLDDALCRYKVQETLYSVRYLFYRGNISTILGAAFVPEQSGAHETVVGRSLLTVWAVRGEERKRYEDLLVTQGLPLLCAWLARGRGAGNSWRAHRHTFSLTISSTGTLTVSEE